MGKGRVRFKKLDQLALDTRGSANASGTRQRRMSHAEREVGAAFALLLFSPDAVTIALVGRARIADSPVLLFRVT